MNVNRYEQKGGGGLAAWCLGGACATVLGFLVFVLVAFATAQEPAKDAGKQTFENMCAKCHPPDRIVAMRRNRLQWEEVLDKMVTLGAQGSDEEFETVLEYLLRHHGRVNVNKAEASEIALVDGISAEDADAIAKYRTAHGNFKDLDALVAVPGIKADKLKENQEAITF